jgi:hypothetical protein
MSDRSLGVKRMSVNRAVSSFLQPAVREEVDVQFEGGVGFNGEEGYEKEGPLRKKARQDQN